MPLKRMLLSMPAVKAPEKTLASPAKKAAPAINTAQIEKLRRSMCAQIRNQMIYKPSLKHGSSRISAEIPNLG